ncbi:MAG: phosphotransferase RcsD [Arsenophonus endosymbiont of Dermacentor nuttalli]
MDYKQQTLQLSSLAYFFIMFISSLVLLLILFAYNYFHNWINNSQNALSNITKKLEYEIEDYRYYANQLYYIANDGENEIKSNAPAPIKLRPDVFWINNYERHVDTIIFGRQNNANINLAHKLSNYMGIIWGAKNEYSSMYYLNGQDNTLLLVTTHSILKPEIRYKESYLTLTSEEKRSEMLSLSSAIDKRESLSNIRRTRPDNSYYYTYRTMFNSPGQLTTIITFELPICLLLSKNTNPEYLSITPSNDIIHNKGNQGDIEFNGLSLQFTQPILGTVYKLSYQLPIKDILWDLLYNNLWAIIAICLFTTISIAGSLYIRTRFIAPNQNMFHEIQITNTISNYIISNIPIGFLLYNFSTNRKIMSNGIAELLLPHMDLIRIRDMAIQHHGSIQISIEDTIYEIKLINSQLLDNTYMFFIHDQDKEALTNKKLLMAQKEHEKNIQVRRSMLANMCKEIQTPIVEIDALIYQLRETSDKSKIKYFINELLVRTYYISNWIENIALLNTIESGKWKTEQPGEFKPIVITEMMNKILKEKITLIINKGLSLYYHNNLNSEQYFTINHNALFKIISLLLSYSINTTNFGKITVIVNYENKHLSFEIIDSGVGLNAMDLANIHIPFASSTNNDGTLSNSGMTFYLCHQLCQRMQGEFFIKSKVGIGAHYTVTLPLELENEQSSKSSPLLDGINILLDIKNPEIHKITQQHLMTYSAHYSDISKNNHHSSYDLFMTDQKTEHDKPTIYLVDNIIDYKVIRQNLIKCNFNFNDALINAISILIEDNLMTDHESTDKSIFTIINQANNSDPIILEDYKKELSDSDYRNLFLTTVPIDINKLYTNQENGDLKKLKDTAHRLKGVFAMLNFELLKKACEQLEQHIADNNEFEILNSIRNIDIFIKKLMPEGNQ